MSARMLRHRLAHYSALALAASLLVSAPVSAVPRDPMTGRPDYDGDRPKTSSSSATGIEKDGRYEESEVKHSFFSFSKPAERTSAAQFARAEKFRADGRWKSAGKAYHALVVTWPRSPEAALAQQRHAEMLAQQGELEDAFEAYDLLIDKYTGSFDYRAIIDTQFRIAQKVMNQRRGRFLLFGGWKAPERAVPMFESIIRHAPRGENAAEAQYLIGVAYEMTDDLELAVVAYMNAQNRYPESAFAEKSAFGRAHCLYVLTEENPNDDEALEQAYAAIVVFLNAFPQSDHAEVATAYRDTLLRKRTELAYQRGVFYDQVAHKPQAALLSYESFVNMYPNSEWTPAARQRIEVLRPLVEKAKKP